MENPLPPDSDRRADAPDGEILAPRTECEDVRPAPSVAARPFEPPVSALGPMFRFRLEQIYACRVAFVLDINTRPTAHVLGGYYKSRRLVRIYSHDRKDGRRPLEELFDTFLHEVAHHLEYTEPQSFAARECRRAPGRMHSRLFWRILGDLKHRWATHQARRRMIEVGST